MNRTRQLVLSAGPNADIKENILNVFGSKQVSTNNIKVEIYFALLTSPGYFNSNHSDQCYIVVNTALK